MMGQTMVGKIDADMPPNAELFKPKPEAMAMASAMAMAEAMAEAKAKVTGPADLTDPLLSTKFTQEY